MIVREIYTLHPKIKEYKMNRVILLLTVPLIGCVSTPSTSVSRTEFEDLKALTENLSSENESLRTRIDTLETSVSTLESSALTTSSLDGYATESWVSSQAFVSDGDLDLIEGDITTLGGEIDTLEADIDVLEADITAVEASTRLVYQVGRTAGAQSDFAEAVDDSAWRSNRDFIDPIELTTSGGDVLVTFHFPAAIRNGQIQAGVTIDERAEGPGKDCSRMSTNSTSSEFVNLSCSQVLSGLEAGTHTFELATSFKGELIETYYGLRLVMTAIELPIE